VDRIGGLRDAIDVAKRSAGLETARVVMYRRADERRENIYSRAGSPAQVNLLPVDLGALGGGGPRFMYLWAPGLVQWPPSRGGVLVWRPADPAVRRVPLTPTSRRF